MEDRAIGELISAKYTDLVGIRNGANWDDKLLACSYMHHRDSYRGTGVRKIQTHSCVARDSFSTYRDGFVGYLMPRDDKWGMLMPWLDFTREKRVAGTFSDIDDVDGLGEYLESLTSSVLIEYQKGNYYTAITQMLTDGMVMGMGYLMPVDNGEDATSFICFDPQECVAAEDVSGHVNVFIRRTMMSPIDILQAYPEEELPKVERACIGGYSGEAPQFEVYEAILPSRYLFDPKTRKRVTLSSKKFAQVVYLPLEQKLLSKGRGYDEMPVVMYRPDHDNMHVPYGVGLVERNIEDIVKLDSMESAWDTAFIRNAYPNYVVPMSMKGQFSSKPDRVNYAVSMSERPVALDNPTDVNSMVASIQHQEEAVRGLFRADLFKTLMSSTDSRKTAYEVSQLKNESMTLLALQIGDLLSEVIEPVFKRTLSILYKNGRVGKYENMRIGMGEDGKPTVESWGMDFGRMLSMMRLELNSVFVRRLNAFLQYEGLTSNLEFLQIIAGISPTSLDNIDMDLYTRQVLVGGGMPFSNLRSRMEVEGIREQNAQMQEEARQAEISKMQSEANRNNAQALQTVPQPDVTNEIPIGGQYGQYGTT